MRGTVLEFRSDTNTGLVSGDDGKRYRFVGTDWRGAVWPTGGEAVDFNPDGDSAREIFPFGVPAATMGWGQFLFSFDGRIARKQYWLRFILPSLVISVILGALAAIPVIGVIYIVYSIALIWPSIAVGAKRCHDRDRSGWFQLIVLIPILGAIWLLIDLGFMRGTSGPNRFGPDPLQQPG